jgi:Signal transduction histidine kinase
LPPPRQILQMPALWIGICLSFFLAVYVAHWESSALRNELRELAKDRARVLHSSMRSSAEVLHALASLHAATGAIRQGHFQLFAQDAVRRHPELQAVEWVPRIPHANREAFEQRKREDGFADFIFTEIGESGLLTRASYRHEYFPVYFLEPYSGNQMAHGFDLGADERRRAALEQARDTGLPVVTAPIRLAQETSTQQGFLMFYPVYATQEPKTVEQRRATLEGFTLAVFRAGDLIGAALGDISQKGISVTIYDTGDPYTALARQKAKESTPLWWHKLALLPEQSPWEDSIDVAGRRWRLLFEPTAYVGGSRQPVQTSLAFAVGLMLTLLLVAYLASAARREREISSANAALQSEISEREKAVEAAQAANRAKSDFLANMSHEIRTPLNAVLGYAQLLRRDSRLDTEQRQAVGAIIASGNHLLNQINSVLDFSKIEIGRMEVQEEVLYLNDLLNELVLMFRPRCHEKGLDLRARLLPEDSPAVLVDGCKLRQILINLLGNSVRFTHHGEVMLGCRPAGDGIYRFDVIDTGVGIPSADLARIFEPFYQGQSHNQSGGTGLGLAIARRHAQLLGGDLEVVSEEGEGTRFTLHLPLPTAAPSHSAMQSDAIDWRLAGDQMVHLLVVDDDEANRDILRRLLTGAGCAVAVAEDHQAALQHLAARSFDVVFLDIRLPGGDSLVWLPKLREVRPHTPVIAYTALAFEQDRERCLAAGCQAFIAKPVQAEVVFQTLENLLGIAFERQRQDEEGSGAPTDLSKIVVPANLLQRLLTAAELHSSTALKAGIEELIALGPYTAPLVERLRQLMRAYDMDEIARLLLTLPVIEVACA